MKIDLLNVCPEFIQFGLLVLLIPYSWAIVALQRLFGYGLHAVIRLMNLYQ